MENLLKDFEALIRVNEIICKLITDANADNTELLQGLEDFHKWLNDAQDDLFADLSPRPTI